MHYFVIYSYYMYSFAAYQFLGERFAFEFSWKSLNNQFLKVENFFQQFDSLDFSFISKKYLLFCVQSTLDTMAPDKMSTSIRLHTRPGPGENLCNLYVRGPQ